MWTPKSWYQEAYAAARENPDYVRGMADLVLRTYAKQAPHLPASRMLELLEASNRRRMDAVPDPAKYPELRGMAELVDAEYRGAIEGAGLSPEQAIAHRDMLWLYRHRIDEFAARTIGCTRVFFADSDVGPVFGSNIDTTIDQPFPQPEWLPINEHLIMSGVSCGIYGDEKSPEIFPAPVFKLLARYCRTTREAVDLLDRYNLFWGPCNSMIIDRSYDIALIEKSSCRMGVRKSTDGFGYVTAMTMAEPSMRDYLHGRRAASLAARDLPQDCADTRYWAEADHRHLLLAELLDEARQDPTAERMRQIMQFRDPARGRVCYWGDVLHPESPPTEYTITTTVWQLRQGIAQFWASGDAKVPSWTARQPDVTFEEALLWG